MNERWKIGIICAAGGALGAFSALEINGYFWWLGLLFGALAGYLTYVAPKIPAAFMAACQAIKEMLKDTNCEPFKLYGWSLPTIGVSATYFMLAIIWCIDLIEGRDAFSTITKMAEKPLFWSGFFLFIWLTASAIGAGIIVDNCTSWKYQRKKTLLLKLSLSAILFYWLPIGLFVGGFYTMYVLIKTPRAIWRVARHIPRAAVFTWQVVRVFAKTFLIAIYSDLALLCAVNIALGAAVGFFAGSVLVGALAGAAFGIFSYEVITLRWLKLKPVNNGH